MAINRAPFNALVDDTGNGISGSVWNKAAIQGVLLDPIDGQLPVFQPVPFNAANFYGTGGMTWTVGAAAIVENRYAVIGGKLMIWSFYVSWFSGANVLGGAPDLAISMQMPGGWKGSSTTILPVTYSAGIAGVPLIGGLYATPDGAGRLQIQKSAGGNFALSDLPGMVTTLVFEVQP